MYTSEVCGFDVIVMKRKYKLGDTMVDRLWFCSIFTSGNLFLFIVWLLMFCCFSSIIRLEKLLMDQKMAWSCLFLMDLNMIMVSDFILATLNLICLGFVMLSYLLNLIHPTVHIDGLLILLSVFDVDIGDGEPIRKLPYNRSGRFLLLPFECLWLCVNGHVFSQSFCILCSWFLEGITGKKCLIKEATQRLLRAFPFDFLLLKYIPNQQSPFDCPTPHGARVFPFLLP